MGCKKCGKCCDPIIMNYSFDYIKDLALTDFDKDALFLLNDCIKITAAEAKTLRPDILDIEDPIRCNLFVCWHFNDETRLCENQNKPGLCRRFPKLPYNYKSNYDCGYNKSLKNIRAVNLLYNSEDYNKKVIDNILTSEAL